MRARAEECVAIELGPRTEQEIRAALEREVDADRWTSLDRRLQRMADEMTGMVDLRPGGGDDPEMRRLLIGRAGKLERLGLACGQGPAVWSLRPGAEKTLRDLSIRTDIIKTMHRAMSDGGRVSDTGRFALHGEAPADPIIGRLVQRGLHDELVGTAYAVIDGADGRTHHLRFDDMEMTGDARPGAIVETRSWQDARGNTRLSLAMRSDLTLAEQVAASGATWLDRELIAREPVAAGTGFGLEIREAMEARSLHLEGAGLAQRRGTGFLFARALITTLQGNELSQEIDAIPRRTGLAHQPSDAADYVRGVYRQPVPLASRRFPTVEHGAGFQLVPRRPAPALP